MSVPPLVRRDRWLWAILALGLGVRLIGLDQPLIDRQAWRQTDTAAIARNFYEEGFNPLYPRVDWRGTSEGYVEANFPLFSWLVAVLYRLSGGPREWLGRLLAALFSTAAALLLYQLSWRLYGEGGSARLSALFLLIFPLSVFCGRAFMPEALMLLLSVAALLTFERWAWEGGRRWLVLAWATTTLSFLVKIPTLYLGFPLVGLAWARWGWGFLRRPVLWGYLGAVLLPPLLWHLHAYQLFTQTGLTFGIWNRYGYDKWGGSLPGVDFYLLMLQRLGHDVFTPFGGLLVLFGLSRCWTDRRAALPVVWMGALVLYLVLVPEGNSSLRYYQLPFVLPGALLAGRALGSLLEGARGNVGLQVAVVLAVLATGAYSVWAAIPHYRPPNNLYEYYQSCHAAGRILDQRLPRDALLVIGDLDDNAGASHRAQSPTMLYYCARKGWQITPDQFSSVRLDSLARLGAGYFVAAGGFVRECPAFWAALVERGISFPSGLPRFWTDDHQFEQARRAHAGADRHFVVVRLQAE